MSTGRSYLVLDDNSTFATDGYFVILNEPGQEQLDDYNDMKCVHPAQGVEVHISLSDLLAAYDKVHGTDYFNS